MMIQKLTSKLLLAGLILITACGVIYAQDNRTAPLEPWIYQAMEFLYQNKAIPDYPSDWVNSGNQLSRFEIAYYLKQFIVHKPESREFPPTVSDKLQKLIAEFRPELTDLGIQVTDIYKISPNLAAIDSEKNSYQDLDILLTKEEEKNPEPHYYYGQYYSELQRKPFIFIPADYVKSNYNGLLDGVVSNISLVYQPNQVNYPSFLVVKGNLPVTNRQLLSGYYLFPIEERKSDLVSAGKTPNLDFNNSVLNLLDEVNQIQRIDNLWRFNGVAPLDGFLPLDTGFQTKPFAGNLDDGLKIGGLLIYTENPSTKNKFELNNFGLPFYNSRQISPSAAVDLDAINGKNLQSLKINILGSVSLSSQTSVYGGLDFLFRGTNTGLDSIWPSDTKASAGLNYHFNDYFTVLTYQSFVNSQLKTGLLSTTSVGVDYDDWVTLWLAYQLLNFDDPVVSGTLSFRF